MIARHQAKHRSVARQQSSLLTRLAAMQESVCGTFAPWRRPSEVVGYAGVKQSIWSAD
jgi:hypothetical protein